MLDIFLFEDPLVWNFPLLAGLIGVYAFYIVLLHTYTEIKIYDKQPLLFFLSLTLLYLTIGSPLSSLNHLSFSLHMIQMSLLFFVIPPLFLLGIPEASLLMIKRLNIPFLAALVTFAILFFFYHFQAVLSYLSLHSSIHNSYLLLLMLLSLLVWRPIVTEQNKRFAFLSGIVLLPACSLLILSGLFGSGTNPLLSGMMASLCMTPTAQNSLSILPPPFNTRADLIIAGLLMMIIHKFAIVLTVRLKNKVLVRDLPGNG
ncbi:cytochrome c oxidase assembly protein [Neobacillus vireti]|uniref:cytochrome c oxidase assembly protein n=1 Tax=Neobacillus vireti TaxID=220686 RepID=UPI002FFF3942